MTRHSPVRIIDPGLVRRRRRQVGLDTPTVARTTRVEVAVINRIESGSNQAGLTLGFVDDLARVLALAPTQMLVAAPSAASAPEASSPGDARTVGAVLASTDAWTPVAALADTLGWTLFRTLRALDALEAALEPAGQVIAWLGEHDVKVVPAPGAEAAAAALEQSTLN